MSTGAPGGEPHGYGFELPMLLFAGFRSIIDELHAELARRGHPDLRPAHGFALQAIGHGGATATETGRRLGVSKQAAGKTIERLEELAPGSPRAKQHHWISWPALIRRPRSRSCGPCWPKGPRSVTALRDRASGRTHGLACAVPGSARHR